VFENRVLRKIFGPERDEVRGGWRKLHNEKLHNLLKLLSQCSHELQPLDVAVYFPFKASDASVCSWLNLHTGVPLSIYDIPENVNICFSTSNDTIQYYGRFSKSMNISI
jgi:hypothetical protein